MKKVIFITSILMGLTALESRGAGTSAAQFLKLGAGARAAGMGDAFTAVSNDVTAAYYNPAGLAQIEAPEVSVMQNSYLVETNYQYLGAALPMRNSAMGFSLYRMDYGSMDRYTAADSKEGSFDAGSLAGSFTFSSEFRDNLFAGLSVKYIQETLENEKGTTFAGDFGVLFKRERYAFGAALLNVGPGLEMVREKDDLPQTFRLGVSGQFLEDKLRLAVDLSKPNDNDTALSLGSEYKLVNRFNIRAGYSVTPGNRLDVDGIAGVTGGMGMEIGRLQLDYAIVPFGDLGMTHRISLLFRFASKY